MTIHVIVGAAVAILAAIELWLMSQNPPRLTASRCGTASPLPVLAELEPEEEVAGVVVMRADALPPRVGSVRHARSTSPRTSSTRSTK